MTPSAPGLRQRKRAALERRLADTAFALVRESGFASVTVDDIVDAVGVSRRTFSNYYSCKEEAVAALVTHRAEDGFTGWRPGPGRPGPVAAVRALVQHQLDSGVFTTMVDVARLARDHPQLVPYLREAQWRLWLRAGSRVLDVLGESDTTRCAEVTAIMGAVFGVVSTILIPAEAAAAEVDLSAVRTLLHHVLDRLETGLGG